MLLVSACLLGICSKYDGTDSNRNELLMEYASRGMMIPVCPEQLGGLATPRRPVEVAGGEGHDVLAGNSKAENNAGENVTNSFVQGAQEVLRIAHLFGAQAAVLKEGSPSCGSHRIYDGTFRHISKPGMGVTAALLTAEGIKVYSEQDLSRELLEELSPT